MRGRSRGHVRGLSGKLSGGWQEGERPEAVGWVGRWGEPISNTGCGILARNPTGCKIEAALLPGNTRGNCELSFRRDANRTHSGDAEYASFHDESFHRTPQTAPRPGRIRG